MSSGMQDGPILNPGAAVRPEKGGTSTRTIMMVSGLVAIVVLTMVLNQFRTTPGGLMRGKSAPKTVSIETEKLDKEIFLKQAGARIEALEVERDTLKRIQEQERHEKDEIRKQISDLSKQIGSIQKTGVGIGDGKGTRMPAGFPPLPPPLSSSGGATAQPASFPVPRGPISTTQVGPTATSAHTETPFDGLRVLFKADPAATKKASEKKFWLNTGTIIPVKLMSGLDAPAKTGSGAGGGGAGGSQQSPYPVLMVVRDLMKLPNEVRADARDCFLLGEGIGELSSERVQVRGTALSCVKENGEAVDIDLRGFVNGEDGKLGLRGRVVMKEGALLGRALLAGFVSGISRAFMPYQQGFFIANSPGQAFNLPPGGPLAMAGAAGGMGRAAEILARNYAQMIGSIFPVIEIDAQREVDFVVGTGREVADYFL